jgi:hypothetical protein
MATEKETAATVSNTVAAVFPSISRRPLCDDLSSGLVQLLF